MTPMRVVLDPYDVNKVLTDKGLEVGAVPINEVLLQSSGGTSGGNAAFLLVLEVDGKPVLAKTTLRLMEMAVMAMRARMGPHIGGP